MSLPDNAPALNREPWFWVVDAALAPSRGSLPVARGWLFAVAVTGPSVVGAVGKVGALGRSGAVKEGAVGLVLLTVTVGLAAVPAPPVESTDGALVLADVSPPVGLDVTETRGWLEPLAVGAVLPLSPVSEGAIPAVNDGLVPVPVDGIAVAVTPPSAPPPVGRRALPVLNRTGPLVPVPDEPETCVPVPLTETVLAPLLVPEVVVVLPVAEPLPDADEVPEDEPFEAEVSALPVVAPAPSPLPEAEPSLLTPPLPPKGAMVPTENLVPSDPHAARDNRANAATPRSRMVLSMGLRMELSFVDPSRFCPPCKRRLRESRCGRTDSRVYG